MKLLERKILPFQEDDFFTPIRSKTDYAKLLAISARLLLIEFNDHGFISNATLKVIVDKMSRLFVYKGDKFFSVSFPFTLGEDNEGQLELRTFSGKYFDNQAISAVISILEDQQFQLNPSPLDFFIGANGFELLGLVLLEEIFQFEPSYVRFDCDLKQENGRLHPLNHIDVNYSGYGTYKLGIYDSMIQTEFENLLDIKTDCSFLEKNAVAKLNVRKNEFRSNPTKNE